MATPAKKRSLSSRMHLPLQNAGGHTVDQKVSTVLKGLGFLESDYDELQRVQVGGRRDQERRLLPQNRRC